MSTENYFFAPDGIQYKAAWGEVEIIGDESLGLKTNSRSTNWYAKVGSKEKHVIIAGCQIHYSVHCNEKPNTDPVLDWSVQDGKFVEYKKPTGIYIAE